VTLVCIFAIPTSLGKTAQYAWFFICYTMLNAVFYTANNIAYSALTSLVTKNNRERVEMGSFRFIFAFSTSLLIQAATIGLVQAFGNDAAAWRTVAIIYTVVGVITNSLSVFSVKELSEEELKENDQDSSVADEKYTLIDAAKLLVANKYYLFVVIPILFLSASIGLFNLIKLLLTIVSFIFGRNDNDETLTIINTKIYEVNQLYKFTLIGIFISLLTTVMILDIILCVTFEQYFLLAISIVIWILLYYLIFYILIKTAKKQISL
jgi:Na+/melibiose symporter-like transporter